MVIGWALLTRPLARDGAVWLGSTCARLLRLLGVRVTWRGVATPSDGRAGGCAPLWAANHLGYLDILVLGASGRVVFVAKREVRSWPIFGGLAALAGTLFIDRRRSRDVARVGVEVAERLAAGVSVVVFLEGTSSDGSGVLPFRASLLEPVVEGGGGVAAVPVALHYVVPSGRDAAREVCWWGDMTLPGHLPNLLTLPWIEARVAWGEAVTGEAASDRKRLAMELRERVAALKAGLASE